MRSPLSLALRPRRALAVAGLVSLGSGLLMLTTAVAPAGAVANTSAGSASQHAGARGKAVKPTRAATRQFEATVRGDTAGLSHSSTTVTGPHLYDPATGKPFANASTVTVTQTSSLVNQMVQVSWTNFTPSSSLTYQSLNTYYPVMVTECDKTNPTSPADCYGAENGGVTSTSGVFGPMNDAYATTAADGTGATDIDIFTTAENQFLGCQQSHACSLAIVPAQGGAVFSNPPNCNDHSEDEGFGGTATGQLDFGANSWACSWAQRIIVPLTFARSPATCPLGLIKHPSFTAEGSPMLARAMDSWIASLCSGSHGFYINYSFQNAEPLALQDLVGNTDVALTTRPAGVQQISTGTRKFRYAPIGVSAVSFSYWFDNPLTGLPYTNISLNQRLMLKLLTQSYAWENDACQPGVPTPPPPGCDNGVENDQFSMFTDPDFMQLNPGIQEPVNGTIMFPTVVSGNNDMTWMVTNWINANADAKAFLQGTFDPWDEHINTYYLNLQYPNNTFVSQDPYPIVQHEFSPVFPLATAATLFAENWSMATQWQKDPVTGNFDRLAPQIPGQRSMIGVLDEGDGAAFRFPAAAILNGAGNYVTPSTSHMLAALQGTISDGNGTVLVNPASKVAKAYPLTMVVYAAVPISGASHAKAAAIAKFLDFAAGSGQNPGVQPGQLPPGFAPLPASMRAQTRKIANEVLHQTGNSSSSNGSNPSSNPGSSPSPNSTPSPGGSVSLPTPGSTSNPSVAIVPVAHVQPASITRFILPMLLILGGLAALAGSSSLVGSSSETINAQLRRIGQQGLAWRRAVRRSPGSRRKP